ncbi:MAG: DUF4013 domain-containing protein [Candidatus Omnitrophica bacterium]|nr:DUF4013 domain-containing protein [Candidatus Omnitrophota bacterium]MCM8802101.1 DUF4013 domain-containing protein [Candidatus Omnitrophota bacterium]
MREKIIESFKQPILKKNLFHLLIGGILMFFPIINFISLGYISEKLRLGILLEKKKLKWDEDIKTFFIKGINLFILILGYFIIPFIFLFLGVYFISILSQGEIASLFLFRGIILIVLSTILFLISLYFLLFGICIYLEENYSFKKGFNLNDVLERIFLIPKDYIIVYIFVVGILLISIVILTLLLNWVTGLLLSGFLLFYDLQVISNLLIKFYPRKSVNIQLPL